MILLRPVLKVSLTVILEGLIDIMIAQIKELLIKWYKKKSTGAQSDVEDPNLDSIIRDIDQLGISLKAEIRAIVEVGLKEATGPILKLLEKKKDEEKLLGK